MPMLVSSANSKTSTVTEKRCESANVFCTELVACLPGSQASYAVFRARMIPMVPALTCEVELVTQFTQYAVHFGFTDYIITGDVAAI